MIYLPTHKTIKTLQDAVVFYSVEENAIQSAIQQRWPDGVVVCPNCGSTNVTWLPSRKLFQCKTRHPKRQFSVKVGSIFEDSPIALGKWLLVMWMLGSCRNGISSYEVARTIGITQKSAWFMLHRIRFAMQQNNVKLTGEIEIDESYIGGRTKNQHVKRRKQGYQKDKVPVVGMIERGGMVTASVVPTTHSKVVIPMIEAAVDKNALIISDNYPIYDPLRKKGFNHEVINHVHDKFVVGNIHTNSIENFWSVLKRTLRGTYVSVTPKHLQAYVTEQCFRHNCRFKFVSEQQRFAAVLEGTTGRRLTYKELIGETT